MTEADYMIGGTHLDSAWLEYKKNHPRAEWVSFQAGYNACICGIRNKVLREKHENLRVETGRDLV